MSRIARASPREPARRRQRRLHLQEPARDARRDAGGCNCSSKAASRNAAIVSDVHGNFILNDGGATARDVLDLIGDIKQAALQERGITLETEVQIIGEDQPLAL